MTRQQRIDALVGLVSERGSISIADIRDELAVSTATARRDLTLLAREGVVTRSRGQAVVRGGGLQPEPQVSAPQSARDAAMARAAVALLSPGDTVGLRGGPVAMEVARNLGRSDRLSTGDDASGVTVVTNALDIAYELSPWSHVKLVITGGVTGRRSFDMVGPLVTSALAELVLDAAIVGVDGLTTRFGATTAHEDEATVSREFVRNARRVIVVADSTRLRQSTFARICGFSEIDVVVTDRRPDARFTDALRSSGIELVVAD